MESDFRTKNRVGFQNRNWGRVSKQIGIGFRCRGQGRVPVPRPGEIMIQFMDRSWGEVSKLGSWLSFEMGLRSDFDTRIRDQFWNWGRVAFWNPTLALVQKLYPDANPSTKTQPRPLCGILSSGGTVKQWIFQRYFKIRIKMRPKQIKLFINCQKPYHILPNGSNFHVYIFILNVFSIL